MNETQFRVLRRQFLFRMVDLELLSADALGDANKLLGQFAALLIFISIILAIAGTGAGAFPRPVEWFAVHLIIATTMLVVGLFAVLSWDSTFPDRRDVLVLAPLPVQPRMLFFARVSAVGTALSVTIGSLHLAAGFVWPLALNDGGLIGFVRTLAAWWITMAAAGVFIYSCVLCVQGITALLLPRRHFLRLSSFLQTVAFGIFVVGYFLEPMPVRSPAWWFTGMFEQLRGSAAPTDMAWRAWFAIGIAVGSTLAIYTLAYFRTMRRIVEEPDIAPAARGLQWLPSFGDGFATAVGQFAIRSLLRSRQHRLLLAFYGGVGFAALILFRQTTTGIGIATRAATTLIVILLIVGTRVVFSLPMDMRANWIFRITPLPEGRDCMVARRRALYAISAVPVWLGCTAALFFTWPMVEAAKHAVVLLLVAAITAELCLRGSQKLPFTCSYLPGKSNFNITFLLWSGFTFSSFAELAKLERDLSAQAYAAVIGALLIVAMVLRLNAPDSPLQFEESAEPAVFELNLRRD